ncbi:uncharacterized protein MELLADRAFT_69793 [Melampsora larici-populina 98AG31]|uniref:Uncharacterized protein n=1 Tax=Melampsora larici-populina (strain 98AG31 / pathotype 3-4-7) TaxID=747676 RepID=F4SC69_MELLP|nr:uncharacterized protein MELLADRAFT_69793 [Melampsora larici-populina 98AG31]EGF97753.1 hypothetical protein MELLADRAFT_69793 [Melampsora larici-populina 98AG31]
MDPSNMDISQSDMYEWLCRRDQRNTVHFNLNRQQLAVKVREAQPKLFPNPYIYSDILTTSVQSQSVTSPESSKCQVQQLETDDSVQKQHLNVHGKRKQSVADEARQFNAEPRSIEQTTNTQMEKLRPRFANYLNPVLPIPPTRVSPSSVIKKEFSSSEEGNTTSNFERRKFQKPLTSTMRSLSVTKILKKEPKRVTTSPNISHQGIASLNHPTRKFIFLEPYKKERKTSEVKENEASPSVPKGYHEDLISFHNFDWFQTKNTVIGKDIVPIKADVSKAYSSYNSKKIKSGVDIFQEERLKEDEVSTLKEQVHVLKEKVRDVEKIQGDIVMLEDKVHTLERGLKVACEKVNLLENLLPRQIGNETNELTSTGEESDCSSGHK